MVSSTLMVWGIRSFRSRLLRGAIDCRGLIPFGRRRAPPKRPPGSRLTEGAVDEVGLRAHPELVGDLRDRDLESERVRTGGTLWTGADQRRDHPPAGHNHLIVTTPLNRDGLDADRDGARTVPARQAPRQRPVRDPGGVRRLHFVRESAKPDSVAGNPPHGSARVHQVERQRRREPEVVGRNLCAHSNTP